MILSTLVIYDRYWYDFLIVVWVVGFFLIEMVLLFRHSLIGWAMTLKCLTLAGVFLWVLVNPPPLGPESLNVQRLTVYLALIFVLGLVIVVLVWMRLNKATVVVGKEGEIPGQREADARYVRATNRETAMDMRDAASTVRESDVADREGTVVTREVAVTERETEISDSLHAESSEPIEVTMAPGDAVPVVVQKVIEPITIVKKPDESP